MVNNKTCISIVDGTFGYKKHKQFLEILKNINLEINSGDFVGVVGLNGCGKSTLLKSLAGLLPILNGEILINECPLNAISNVEMAKMISIVLTEKISGFNLTSFDAVAAGQLPYTN